MRYECSCIIVGPSNGPSNLHGDLRNEGNVPGF